MTSSAPPPPEDSAPQPPPVAEVHHRSAREEFRRARTRSQTVVFGSAIIGLVIVFLLGFLGMSGALPLPFGGEFSKKETFAEPGDTPCPLQGARAEDPAGVSLRVLNTTSRPGLAGAVSEDLEGLGYEVIGVDNAPQYHGFGRIEAGPRGVNAAYSLARFFPGDMRIVLTTEESKTLTVVLGNRFEGLVPKDEREELVETKGPLVPIPGCIQVQEPKGGWAVPTQSGQSQQSGD